MLLRNLKYTKRQPPPDMLSKMVHLELLKLKKTKAKSSHCVLPEHVLHISNFIEIISADYAIKSHKYPSIDLNFCIYILIILRRMLNFGILVTF